MLGEELNSCVIDIKSTTNIKNDSYIFMNWSNQAAQWFGEKMILRISFYIIGSLHCPETEGQFPKEKLIIRYVRHILRTIHRKTSMSIHQNLRISHILNPWNWYYWLTSNVLEYFQNSRENIDGKKVTKHISLCIQIIFHFSSDIWEKINALIKIPTTETIWTPSHYWGYWEATIYIRIKEPLFIIKYLWSIYLLSSLTVVTIYRRVFKRIIL